MELKGKKINFLGDSITHAGNLGDDTKRFTYLIEQECDAIVRNYGVGGTCIAKSLKPSEVAEWDQDFISRVDGMDSDADIVVVFGGTNDYGHGTVPIGTMDDRTDDTFYGALHTLYTMLLNKYPYAQLVVMTPLHRFNENKSQKSWKGEGGEHLLTFVNIIREVAEYYAIPVLDTYATSGIQPSVPIIRDLYTVDGLHPNALGHRVLANKIIAFLKTL